MEKYMIQVLKEPPTKTPVLTTNGYIFVRQLGNNL